MNKGGALLFYVHLRFFKGKYNTASEKKKKTIFSTTENQWNLLTNNETVLQDSSNHFNNFLLQLPNELYKPVTSAQASLVGEPITNVNSNTVRHGKGHTFNKTKSLIRNGRKYQINLSKSVGLLYFLEQGNLLSSQHHLFLKNVPLQLY